MATNTVTHLLWAAVALVISTFIFICALYTVHTRNDLAKYCIGKGYSWSSSSDYCGGK